MSNIPWWHSGIHFTCTGSGQCCRTNGEYAYVYMEPADIQRAAAFLEMTTSAFRKKYITKEDGYAFIKYPERDCIFLNSGKCTIYGARPKQCRDWPFWKESLERGRAAWEREVLPICRGCRNGEKGKGRYYSAETIRKILATQKD